ncbi:MAG TPA: signal peptidase II [Exilispira sp.]|nr:signal peptidase II [Spirochaetota bacterium]NLJ04657.1 signal peptidase II [Exilispira sp.]HNV43199.1 signal peptidase II [Exilispira sp.]HOV45620.1 signal peptidase II [Exilispira sp.]HPO60016.1 signal peptidase II [Exilispira sp.]
MNKNKLNRILLVLLIILVTVALDQLTKYIVSVKIPIYGTIRIIPGFLNFRHITNYGFLLGLGSNLNDGSMFNPVVIITIIALIILLAYFIYIVLNEKTSKYLLITFSILIGGAWGNFIDRLIKGKVVDFIEFTLPAAHWGRYYFSSLPIFNLADFFVSVGIIMLLIYYFIIEPKENKKLKAGEEKIIDREYSQQTVKDDIDSDRLFAGEDENFAKDEQSLGNINGYEGSFHEKEENLLKNSEESLKSEDEQNKKI